MRTVTKEYCIQKYHEYKETFQKIPKFREFIKFAGLGESHVVKLYGENAYAKLQVECGDVANKLNLEIFPRDKIMRQYADLAIELGKLPTSSHWIHRGLKPTISGLRGSPHEIKWSDFPFVFRSWVESEKISEYQNVLDLIDDSSDKNKPRMEKQNREFEKIIFDIRSWSPARRRNTEESYKIELRKHLESIGYLVNEEFGESKFDLLINQKYAVEIKKDPPLSEYDRLFGQLARHLQNQLNVVCLILDAPSEDKLQNFMSLVDSYLNKDDKLIEVIKK